MNAEKLKLSSQNSVKPWLVIAFVLVPVFIGSLDLTVVSAFLPKLITELGLPFDTGLDDAAWMVTGYLVAYTISLTFMGRLSDLYGRKAIYVACLFVFILGSLITVHAGAPLLAGSSLTDALYYVHRRLGERPDPSYVELQVIIIGRIVAAIGAGALVPVSLALVGDLFPPEKRAQPLGLIGAVDTLGWVAGPVYGAVLLRFMSWQGLFLLNVPLTLITLAVVLYGLRDVPQQRVQGRFDLLGAILIGVALAGLSLGLGANIEVSGLTGGLNSLSALPPYALPVLSLAIGAFLLFILVESRVKDPLFKLDMFRRKNLSAGAVVNLFVGYALFIGLVSIPVLINLRAGDTSKLDEAALLVGELLATLTIPMAIATVPGGWISERIGNQNTVRVGLAISIVGFLLVWQTWTVDITNEFLAVQMMLVGVGIGLTFSPISAAIINSALDKERGVAGAIVLILRLVGMTLSVASLSSFMLTRVAYLTNLQMPAQFDAGVYADLYVNSAVQVLREIGLLGALLCAVAIIPTLWMDRTAHPPNQS
jgi:MFS family permease